MAADAPVTLVSRDSQPATWVLGVPLAGLDSHFCPLSRWLVGATVRGTPAETRTVPQTPNSQPLAYK